MKTQEKITAGVLAVIISIAGGVYAANSTNIICTNETIPFVSTTEKTDNLSLGKSQIKFAGITGTRKVCRSTKDEVVSNDITLEPQNQVTIEGTQPIQQIVPPPVVITPITPVVPASTICSGYPTLCNDGSCSSSTGRGTCSHHGGVDRYL